MFQRRLAKLLCAAPSDTLRRCAEGRRRINDLWTTTSRDPYAIYKVMTELEIHPAVALERDVTRGLGEGLERLLVLAVEGMSRAEEDRLEGRGGHPDAMKYVSDVLKCAARNGIEFEIRTVQHVFARCYNYVQALALFDEIKRCGIAMHAHAYYAMVFCLQRLEEESWGRQFNAERKANKDAITSEMMEFVLNGCENQLVPENKPYLGRVMFSDVPQVFANSKGTDFDATGKEFIKRYQQERPT